MFKACNLDAKGPISSSTDPTNQVSSRDVHISITYFNLIYLCINPFRNLYPSPIQFACCQSPTQYALSQAYIFFIADTTLMVEISSRGVLTLKINQIPIEIATIFFNPAISFVPCFKYVDSQDVILFTSKNLHYLVDSGGQFNENYYGMKHNLIDCISSEEIYVDLNDEHVFKSFKLAALLTESKTVVYSPFYRLQLQVFMHDFYVHLSCSLLLKLRARIELVFFLSVESLRCRKSMPMSVDACLSELADLLYK
jgi:hypothetical protein